MKKFNVAIVGAGGIADVHIRAYRQNPEATLYALCDIDEKKLKEKGMKYGITRLYTDEKKMLSELPEIDVVDVCTWNSEHAPCAITAMQCGKDVFCEKPMATNPQDARKMAETAEKTGRKLMIGFVRRFGSDARVCKDFISADKLGEIYYAKVSYLRRNGNPGRWFCRKEISGGGPLIDLGVHMIDLARYLMGNPKPVSVYGATFDKIGARKNLKDGVKISLIDGSAENDVFDVEDLATALVRFDNGAIMQVDASYNLNIKQDLNLIELYGVNGGISLSPSFEYHGVTDGYLTDTTLSNDKTFTEAAFGREISYFFNAIKNDTDISDIARDGIVATDIIDGIYRSAATRCEVKL